jgi:dipeptidyl aminopeptidase/acylaminoacyl peptidase
VSWGQRCVEVRELAPADPGQKDGTLGAAYAWSPDGLRMVFDCGGTSGTNVCMMDVASGKSRVLLDPEVKFGSLDWSPDGTSIVDQSGLDRLTDARPAGGGHVPRTRTGPPPVACTDEPAA